MGVESGEGIGEVEVGVCIGVYVGIDIGENMGEKINIDWGVKESGERL